MRALVSNAEQGTLEWKKDRIGYVTASSVGDVMAKGQGKSRASYMAKMICEILTGEPVVGYKSSYMQDGNDREEKSRQLYTLITGNPVTQVGFSYLEDEKLGASLDGEVGMPGMVEFKNVIADEQIRLLTLGTISGKYIKQMQTGMYVREKEWCDYVSTSFGDPVNGYLPDKYKIKIIRVYRDEALIKEIRESVATFHIDVQKMIKKLESK